MQGARAPLNHTVLSSRGDPRAQGGSYVTPRQRDSCEPGQDRWTSQCRQLGKRTQNRHAKFQNPTHENWRARGTRREKHGRGNARDAHVFSPHALSITARRHRHRSATFLRWAVLQSQFSMPYAHMSSVWVLIPSIRLGEGIPMSEGPMQSGESGPMHASSVQAGRGAPFETSFHGLCSGCARAMKL